jgi:alginate O-acetyltransferase complex protein AlgI
MPAAVLKLLRIALVFGFVTIGWLLFRLDSFADVIRYLARMLQFAPDVSYTSRLDAHLALLLTATTLLYQLAGELLARSAISWRRARPAVLAAMLVFILLGSGDRNAFIYFQF